MKAKILLLSVLLVAALTLPSSCKGDEPEPGYSVNTDLLKVADINLLGSTTDTVFTIEANSAWNLSVVSGDESSLKLSHKSGSGTSMVRITPGPNPSAMESRSWQLLVTTAAGLTRNVSITQSVTDVDILVSPGSIIASAENDTITLSVNSNATWTAVLTGKARNFVHFMDNVSSGSGAGTIDLIFDRNEDIEAREGGLQLTATDSQGHRQNANVTIRQEGRTYSLTVHYKQKTLSNNEQWFDISFHSDLDWEIVVSGEWLIPTQYSGSSSQTNLRVKAEANPTISVREADVFFTIRKDGKAVASDTCHIVQAAFGAPEVEILDDVTEETTATLSARCITDAAKVGVITACGFRYSTDKEALEMGGGIDVPCKADDLGQDTLVISTTITGLNNNLIYYYIAYATNNRGTGQSKIATFKTGGKDPDESDLTPPPTP